jgi:hypothetical protein
MLLRQPAGDLLAVLVEAPGGAGRIRSVPSLAGAMAQLRAWGLARFGAPRPPADVVAPFQVVRFRVTALGRAAHAWGWAARHEGGRSEIPGYLPRGGRHNRGA